MHVCGHVCGCISVCVRGGRVAGCLPVFSLARLHTAAWQLRAGQLNSLDGEKRAREREGKRRRRRGGKKRGGGTLRARPALGTHAHIHTHRNGTFTSPQGAIGVCRLGSCLISSA